MAGQVVNDPRRGRFKPASVSDEKVRPTDHAVGIGVADYRPDSGPRLSMRFNQRRGPTGIGIRMILGESDHWRCGLADAGSMSRSDGSDCADFDKAESKKVLQIRVVQFKLIHRWRNDHDLQVAFGGLRP